jgi:hypothetical protein
MAASKFITIPFHMVLSLWFVRRHVPFGWGEMGVALWKSAAVTVGTVIGPLCVVALSEQGFALSLSATALAAGLAAAGWLAGVLVFRHPVLEELSRIIDEVPELPLMRLLRARMLLQSPRAGEAR